MQTTGQVNYDQEAWDLSTRFSFRPELFFDHLATEKATAQDKPGTLVNFTFTGDVAPATTPLGEQVDVDGKTFSDNQVQVPIQEYGDAIVSTARLRGTSFIPVDPVIANLIGFQAGLSVDTLARNALAAGTNVLYGGAHTARNQIVKASVLTASLVRRVVAQKRKTNVPTLGGFYAAFVNPDQSVDLRQETGAAAWRDPHVYTPDSTNIWNGEIGAFEGCRFIEAPRVPILLGAGAGSPGADVYQAFFVGAEALAKAYSSAVSGPTYSTRPTPVTDKLHRFTGMGWYWMGGYGILRQESVRRVETGSSLGA